ncbi:hypothetical protein DMI69_23925 [Escherichia coli]|nr:hypothetical protein [Escherichia coli]
MFPLAVLKIRSIQSVFSPNYGTEGADVVPSYDDADMVIVNTSVALLTARYKNHWKPLVKRWNENGKVIVTGCLGQRRSDPRSPPESAGNHRAS